MFKGELSLGLVMQDAVSYLAADVACMFVVDTGRTV